MERDLDILIHADPGHAEGPWWDERSSELVWVDLSGRIVHRTSQTGLDRAFAVPQDVGAVVPRGKGFVAMLRDGFWEVTGEPSDRPTPIGHYPRASDDVRLNDAKCDPSGRLWAGSMADDLRSGAGSLFRLAKDGVVATVLTDVTVANGLGWSPDGATFYFIDSMTGRVDAFDVDPASGAIEARRPAVRIPENLGLPDGLTVDAEGYLWVAIWGGACVRRHRPDGRLDGVVELPCRQVTSCAFGGADGRDLFITTSSSGMTESDRRKEPLAGAVFRYRTGVAGLPVTAFDG